MSIELVDQPISIKEVKKIAANTFGDMAKAVVDVEKQIMAIGGDMHADAEQVLLSGGSLQKDLWGINIYPDSTGERMVEFESLINIRPSQDNRSMEVQDAGLREKIVEIVNSLIIRRE